MGTENIPPETNIPSNEENCRHSLRIDALCAICGAELPKDESLVPVIHFTDRLFHVPVKAYELQRLKNRELKKKKLMILILDLDQTLLHASPTEIDCDFVLSVGSAVFYVKLRPHLQEFLKETARLFEIHIYTMGTREYATEICRRLDPDGCYFGDRIVSRCENFNEMKKSISRITCISKNVVILDDRADVWNYNKNLVLIRPFWYENRIDINDPTNIPYYEQGNGSILEDEVLVADVRIVEGAMRAMRNESKEVIKTECRMNKHENVMRTMHGGIREIVEGNSLNSGIVRNSDALRNGKNTVNIKNTINIVNPTNSDDIKKPPVSLAESPRRSEEMAGPQDKELLNALRTLKRVHKKYFRTKKPVEKLLRLKQMKKIRIASRREYFSIIVFAGANLDLEHPTFVLDDEEMAMKKKTKNVNIRWIYECLYRRKVIPIGGFVIGDYSEDDEYALRLKSQFF